MVLVFSCGVGVQTISEYLEEKMGCAACDTYPVPGFQGVTPLEYKCDQCGECYLNLTEMCIRDRRRGKTLFLLPLPCRKPFSNTLYSVFGREIRELD